LTGEASGFVDVASPTDELIDQVFTVAPIAAALLCVVHVQGAEDHSAHVKGEVIVTLPMKLADFTEAKQASYVKAIKAASKSKLEAVKIEKTVDKTDKVEVHTEIEAHDKADFEAAEKALTQANVDTALVAAGLPRSTAYQFVEEGHAHSSATCMKPTPVAVLAAATAIVASALRV